MAGVCLSTKSGLVVDEESASLGNLPTPVQRGAGPGQARKDDGRGEKFPAPVSAPYEPSARDPRHPSSISLTLRNSTSGCTGFMRSSTPGPSSPLLLMKSAV